MKRKGLIALAFIATLAIQGNAQNTKQLNAPSRQTTAYVNYKMAGPYEVVARDGEFRGSKNGSERDMRAAWELAKAGHHEKACEIINAYADKLQRLDGHDAPLCLIQGYWLCRAMMEEKPLSNSPRGGEDSISSGGLSSGNAALPPTGGAGEGLALPPTGGAGRGAVPSWSTMLCRAFLPTMDKFEADSPYANGNWGAIVNRFRMAAALAMGDTVMYRDAIEHFLHANDNSALPNYVSQTGQCQETGRDQAHAQLGLGALCDICEMAWQQGDDLWGALDNRLMKGIEYTARYNLGYDVPFETWTDCTGLYNDWTEPGAMARGRIQNIYDQPYNHYVGRRGLKMPYTKKLLALQRKAERQNKVKQGIESNEFTVPGVSGSLPNGEGVGRGPLHQVFTYPASEGAPLKHDYDVYVCPRGSKEWTKVDTYMAKVNVRPLSNSPRGGENSISSGGLSSGNAALPPTGGAGRGARHKISEISYCFFDFTGDVFVRVVTKNKKFKSARIRPDYRGTIANVQNDSTVQFLLFQPENVSVEFDGNITDNLLVFTSKPPVSKEEAEAQAKKEGRQFIYIPAGFYEIKDKRLEIKDSQAQPSLVSRLSSLISDGNILVPSNTTLYLAPGAYFTSTFAIEDTRNVSILGRGIARPPRGYEGAHVHRSQNVLIDGLVVNTCPIGAARNVTLHDVRSISHPGWGDGLNVFGGSSDILFDRVFCRNSDDCTTAYATRKGFSGSTRNIHMRNSTLWADVAHPIFIGLHGNPEVGDTIEHLVYENIDILGQAEPQVDYQGCLAINCGDGNLVRDVLFDNIRIEQIEEGSIAQVKVSYNQKYCTAPGRGVEDVTFRGVRYYGATPRPSIINGYDADHRVQNVSFEGLKINGKVISDDMAGKPKWYATADYVPMYVGNHVSGVAFSREAGKFSAGQQLAYCSSQVDRALEALRPYDFTQQPRNIQEGQTTWNTRKAIPEEWCSGFWPGILWMDYSYNSSEAVRKAAEGYTEAITAIVEQPVFDHDLGFITINSFIKGYEQTKDERYRQLALHAASELAKLFNEKAGTLLSWPRHVKDFGGHNTIMDNMINLELLLWAANELKNENVKSEIGDSKSSSSKYYDIAFRHAETTMNNHFRPDGSCYHVAIYDTLDGHFIKGKTHQGYSDQSMWSRGQSWAVYGFTMAYRYTHDRRFLDHARKVTDIYLKRLSEASDDWVPIWDMDAPADKHEKDASTACIVASALLELCQYVDEGDKEMVSGKAVNRRYYEAAIAMLRDLSTERYQSRSRNVSFLMHSVGNRPSGSEIDASIIYADYYYIEALLRLKVLAGQ